MTNAIYIDEETRCTRYHAITRAFKRTLSSTSSPLSSSSSIGGAERERD